VSAPVLLAIALITYASRAAAVVLLPRPGPRLQLVLSRIPAPIFASLATATLVGDGGVPAEGPVLAAAAGALLASPARSLLPCLIGGAVGYAAGVLLLPR
jgi:branched-subunit amino acid transport protein